MTKVIIELEFDNHKNDYEVTDAQVINYLQELIDNDCLIIVGHAKNNPIKVDVHNHDL